MDTIPKSTSESLPTTSGKEARRARAGSTLRPACSRLDITEMALQGSRDRGASATALAVLIVALTLAARASAWQRGCTAPKPGVNVLYAGKSSTGGSASRSKQSAGLPDIPAGTKTLSYGALNSCDFDGTIVMSQVLSLTPGDKFYEQGLRMRWAMMIFIDMVNENPPSGRGGIKVGNKTYGVQWNWVDDKSSTALMTNATAWGSRVFNSDFIWGGYGSGGSQLVARQANVEGKLCLAAAASRPWVCRTGLLRVSPQPYIY